MSVAHSHSGRALGSRKGCVISGAQSWRRSTGFETMKRAVVVSRRMEPADSTASRSVRWPTPAQLPSSSFEQRYEKREARQVSLASNNGSPSAANVITSLLNGVTEPPKTLYSSTTPAQAVVAPQRLRRRRARVHDRVRARSHATSPSVLAPIPVLRLQHMPRARLANAL
jgi:hypothetical protein